jgi:peptidoglycan/xylan/chitin deacetylase (PgdA/CDA1 family)
MLAYMIPSLLILSGTILLVLLAWGSFCVCSGLYIKTYCRGNTSEKKLALTFDDGPHATITLEVLDILKAHHIKAGFFLIGENIERNEDIVRRIPQEGHILGNHSYSHSNYFGFRGTKCVTADLRKNEALIEGISGKKPGLFRPPFGVTNPNIARAARLLDYRVVGWDIRSLDTVSRHNDRTIKRVIKRLKPGAMILFHDNHERIVPILEGVIKKAIEEEYEFVSPDVLLNLKAYK